MRPETGCRYQLSQVRKSRHVDADAWTDVFSGSDACVTPVLSFAEAAERPHVRARGTLVEADGVVQAAPAPRFSRTPAPGIRPPRTAADDVAAVLADWDSPSERQEIR